MQKYSNEEIDALGIQIGCIIRNERLKKNFSQEDLGLLIGSNNTTIGRIERYENSTNWKHLIKVCQVLEIDFHSLFELQSLKTMLSIIQECRKIEDKLTLQKEKFYLDLEKSVKKLFKNNIDLI